MTWRSVTMKQVLASCERAKKQIAEWPIWKQQLSIVYIKDTHGNKKHNSRD